MKKFNFRYINKNSNFLLILYLIGILHWYLFMQLGNPTWKSFDWMGMHQVIYDVIRESIQQWKIPYHYTGFDVPVIGTPVEAGTNSAYDVRLFSQGYNLVSPQALLFGIFSTPIAMTLNLLFYYSVGFLGIYLWQKKMQKWIAIWP